MMSIVASPPDRFESLRGHLVDYLYNEADADTVQAIESAMVESDAFSLEVDALARTLRISRRALAVASSSAPSRMRSSVLAAAAEQAARMREAVPVLARAEVRNESALEGDAGNALATLWRWFSRPYTFSLVGAAAVFAIFVMTRGTNAPELADQAMRSVAEPKSEPEATATAAAPTEGQPGRENDDKAAPSVRYQTEPLGKLARKNDGSGIGASKGGAGLDLAKKKVAERAYATPPSDWAESSNKPSPKRMTKDFGGKAELKGLSDDLLAGAAGGSVEAESARQRAPQKSAPAAAPPPPNQVNAAPAEAPASPSQEPPGLDSQARSRSAKPSGLRRDEPSAATASDESVEQESDAEKKAEPALSRADLLARAKKLEAAKSYDEAAAVWAELVRRFPKDPQVAAWRRAEMAARAARN
jgi:hypothetical protein